MLDLNLSFSDDKFIGVQQWGLFVEVFLGVLGFIVCGCIVYWIYNSIIYVMVDFLFSSL